MAKFFHCLLGLLSLSLASISFAQTASYHDHNIFHGAGSAYVNTSPEAQNVGAGGTLRAQLIWNVMPGQTKGGDLDLHTKAPDGKGPYTVTQFDPNGAIASDASLRTPPFGSPNTSPTGNQQVNWVNRQILFANGNSVATLDTDNRDGVPNSPSGSLVENIYYGGTVAAPGYIPSGKYQFAVHNFNYTALSDPKTDYALWITTNGKVGVRSEGHYRGTGQEAGKPGLPVWVGQLQTQGQSSQIYEIEIVNPGVEPHNPGIQVIDQKQKYRNDWFAYQRALEARRKYLAELAHQSADDTATTRAANIPSCPPAPMMCDLASLYRNQSIENFVRSTSPRFIQDSFSPPPAPSPERYAVKVTWVDYNTNWLGYAYIEGTREETLYFKDRASAEKVAKSEAEKWGIINEQQQYENDHALAYGTIKAVSYAGDKVIEGEQKYQVVTRVGGGLQAIGGAGQISVGVAGGIASCPVTVGAGCVGGAALAINGLDDFQAGIRTAWTGQNISTVKSEALQSLGVSKDVADISAGVISLGGTVAYSRVIPTVATQSTQIATTAGQPTKIIGPVLQKATDPIVGGVAIDGISAGKVIIPAELMAKQGTSPFVGNFINIKGATIDEIISRAPKNWAISAQDGGVGIKFLDEAGNEMLRIHGPSVKAPVGSNSSMGWVLRVHVPGVDNKYYDDLGNIVGSRANEGHIPIFGNSNLK